MKVILVSLFLFVVMIPTSWGQEPQQVDELESINKNLIAFSFGYTFIPKATSEGGSEPNGIFVPTIGLDYFHLVSPKFAIGTMVDLELSNYLIFEKNLKREKALLVTLVGSYELFEKVSLFAGGGIELEKHKNLAVFRLGVDYMIDLKKDWIVGTGFFYDIKQEFNTWSLSIILGKEF